MKIAFLASASVSSYAEAPPPIEIRNGIAIMETCRVVPKNGTISGKFADLTPRKLSEKSQRARAFDLFLFVFVM